MACIRYAFPGVKINKLSDKDFCLIAEEADYVLRLIHGDASENKANTNTNVIKRTS